jgi:Tol biopolymer transport system component
MRTALTLLFLGSLVAGSVGVAQTRPATDLYQEGLQYEEVKGDLAKAIATYQLVLERFASDRPVAARAQFHLALCYERLGRPEAVQAYQSVIRDYADQPDLVAQARSRLAALQARAPAQGDTALRESTQVWTGPEVNLEGRPSADGRYLAFIDRSLGRDNVAVRDLRTGKNRLVTHAKTSADGSAEYPAMSPDGSLVVYGWFLRDRYSLRLSRADGTGMGVLATPSVASMYAPPVWAPNGRQIAVVFIGEGRAKQIGLVAIADGTYTQLLSLGSRSAVFGGFSPDGRNVIFSAEPGGAPPNTNDRDIFSVAVDGTDLTTLVPGGTRDSQPVWTPDGGAIVFVSDRSGADGLWSVRIRDGKPVGSPVEVRPDIGTADNLGFSRDGRFLYGLWSTERDVYLARVDPATLSVTSAPKRLSDHFEGADSTPHWSPDGRSIAFLRRQGRTQTIVIRSVADGVERTLPTTIRNPVFLTAYGFDWFPDGRSLLVRDSDPDRERRVVIRRIDADSGKDVVLWEAGDWDVWPPMKISPDGTSVYYTALTRDTTRNVNHLRLMKRDLASGRETELYQRETGFFSTYGLMASPDGSRLIFLDNVGSRLRTLVTLPVSGGTPAELHPSDGPYPRPLPDVTAWTRSWAENGRSVITKTTGGVWAFPTDGGTPRKLEWNLPEVGELSPDGTQTVYPVAKQTLELRTIENLLSRIPPAR